MTSKERARIAMSGGVPDRVPVIPQLCPPHAIRASGLPFKETAVDWLRNPGNYELFEAECAKNYGFDGFRVWLGSTPQKIEWEGEDAYQIDPETGDRVGLVDFMGGCAVEKFPELKKPLTDAYIDSIEVVPWEELIESDLLKPVKRAVAQYGSDMFIIGVPTSFCLEALGPMQGMQQTLLDMIDRPDLVIRTCERLLETSIQQAIALTKIGVDALYIGESYGGFMSPQQFSKIDLPLVQRFVETLRQYDVLQYLHMCGHVTHLLDLIAESGADCLEPLDEVGGTSVAEVKRRIGDKVALMGGVNTVVLSQGTVEEVRQDCVRCIREGGEGGGYILAACDMLPTETDPEAVRAMVETAETCGRYDGS